MPSLNTQLSQENKQVLRSKKKGQIEYVHGDHLHNIDVEETSGMRAQTTYHSSHGDFLPPGRDGLIHFHAPPVSVALSPNVTSSFFHTLPLSYAVPSVPLPQN